MNCDRSNLNGFLFQKKLKKHNFSLIKNVYYQRGLIASAFIIVFSVSQLTKKISILMN